MMSKRKNIYKKFTAENAEFTENRFLIGDYSSIIQCNSSVIGSICTPKLRFGNSFLNLFIFAKQSFPSGPLRGAIQISVLTCD